MKNIRLNVDVNVIKNNLLVDCKHDFLRLNDKHVIENNPAVQANGKTPEEFCVPDLLENYGLQPIPVNQIGPKDNKWLIE